MAASKENATLIAAKSGGKKAALQGLFAYRFLAD
jgi:hypothetical protein